MQNFRKNIYRTNSIVEVISFSYSFSNGKESIGLACQEVTFPITLYCADSTLVLFSRLYTNSDLTGNFNGVNQWYKLGTKSYRINSVGEIIEISVECGTLLPLTEYCYTGIYDDDDTQHVPPGGVITWRDEFNVLQTRSGLTNTTGIFSVYASNIPTKNSAAIQVDCDTGDQI